jgi:hypothetical protein
VQQSAGYLDIFRIRHDIPYQVYFGFIYMPERKMKKQITESEYGQFFFKQVGTLGSYTFQVFNGAV